jgi:hypothetical protein
MVVFKSIYSLDDSDIMPKKPNEKKRRVVTQAEIDREDTVNNIVETCIQHIDVIATSAATNLRNSMLTNVASDAIRNKDRSTWKAYAQGAISRFQGEDGTVYITEDIVNEATTAVNDAMYQTALEAIRASIARDSNIHRSTATNDNPFSMLGDDMVSDSDESEPPLEERGVAMSSAAAKSGPALKMSGASGTYTYDDKPGANPYRPDQLNAYTLSKVLETRHAPESKEQADIIAYLDLMQEASQIGAIDIDGYIEDDTPGVSRTYGLLDIERNRAGSKDWGVIGLDVGGVKNVTIGSTKATPNKTLATALREALKIIRSYNTGAKKKGAKKKGAKKGGPAEDKSSTNSDDDIVDSIEQSSRDNLTDAEINTANAIITEAIRLIELNNLHDNETKLKQLLQIFSPLLMKGLSDISQYGETVKTLLLQILAYRLNHEDDSSMPEKYSDYSIPFIAGFTSDGIAWILGILIQDLLGISVHPRKTGRGETLVFLANYAFIALMRNLSKVGYENIYKYNTPPIASGNEIDELCMILRTFLDTVIETNARFIFTHTSQETIGSMCEKAIFKYDTLLNLINEKYQRTSIPSQYASIIDKLNAIFDDVTQKQTLIHVIQEQYMFTVYIPETEGDVLEIPKIPDDTWKQGIIDLLAPFDVFIRSISDYVEKHNDFLVADTIKWMTPTPGVRTGSNRKDTIHSWVEKVYTSVTYYNNCKTLFSSNLYDLLGIYMSVCGAELRAAVGDVTRGHDHAAITSVELLGRKLAALMFPGNISTDISKWQGNGEQDYCEEIMKTHQVLPFAQSAQARGASLSGSSSVPAVGTFTVYVDPKYLPFDPKIPTRLLSDGQIDWPHVGGHVHCSVDFVRGSVASHWWSKSISNGGFSNVDEIIDLLKWGTNQVVGNIQTKYDQAAGTGCLTMEVGDRAINVHFFMMGERRHIYFVYTQSNFVAGGVDGDDDNDDEAAAAAVDNTPQYRIIQCAAKQMPASIIFKEDIDVQAHYIKLQGSNELIKALVNLNTSLDRYFSGQSTLGGATPTGKKIKIITGDIINRWRQSWRREFVGSDGGVVESMNSERDDITDIRYYINTTNTTTAVKIGHRLFDDMMILVHTFIEEMIKDGSFNLKNSNILLWYLTTASQAVNSTGSPPISPSGKEDQKVVLKTPPDIRMKSSTSTAEGQVPTPVRAVSQEYSEFIDQIDTKIGGTLVDKGYDGKYIVRTQVEYETNFKNKEIKDTLMEIIGRIVIRILQIHPVLARDVVIHKYYTSLTRDQHTRFREKCYVSNYNEGETSIHDTVLAIIGGYVNGSRSKFDMESFEIPQNRDPSSPRSSASTRGFGLGGASRRKRRTRAKKATKQRKITKRKCNIKHNKRRYTKHKRAKKASKHTRKRKH